MPSASLIKDIPIWILLLIIVYIAILVTIAVIRGQAVEFFPPKIGPILPRLEGFNGSGSVSDLRIDGNWYLYFGFDTKKTKSSSVGSANIDKIQGNLFKMTINLTKSKQGNVVNNTFCYEGTVENRQILAKFRSENYTGDFMVGTIVMLPNQQGDRIFCGATYVNRKNKIIMDQCLLMRT